MSAAAAGGGGAGVGRASIWLGNKVTALSQGPRGPRGPMVFFGRLFGRRRQASVAAAALPAARRGRRVGSESLVRDWLAASVPGSRTEVPCSAGTVDVLTPEEVIEVKCARQWKAGLGQVLAYSLDFPGRRRRLHLFHPASDGAGAGEHYHLARAVCASLDVRVTHSRAVLATVGGQAVRKNVILPEYPALSPVALEPAAKVTRAPASSD